jgi:ubiquinone/menaquinone biosynthesis C-methylase UbiE
MDIRKIVKEGYEKGDYVGHFRTSNQPNEMEKKLLDRLANSLSKDAKILDLGCGTGIPFDKYLVELGFKLTGVDFASNHIISARKNVPNATFIKSDFSKLDFGIQKFDAIIAFYSIFHIPREEQQELFKKMNSLLVDGGLILVTLATSDSEDINENWTGAPMAWSQYSPTKYKVMLTQAGFIIAHDEYEGQPSDAEYHWWVLARKKNIYSSLRSAPLHSHSS